MGAGTQTVMNGTDLALLALLLLPLLRGVARGLGEEILGSVALGIGLLAGVVGAEPLLARIEQEVPTGVEASLGLPAAFAACVAAGWLIVRIVGLLLTRWRSSSGPGIGSRLAGGILGGLRAAFVFGALLLVADFLVPAAQPLIDGSVVARRLRDTTAIPLQPGFAGARPANLGEP